MFSLICVWINGWVNNREAGDLRRHRGHYYVNVMTSMITSLLRAFRRSFYCIFVQISLEFLPTGPITLQSHIGYENGFASVRHKPLSEPVVAWLTDEYMRNSAQMSYMIKSLAIRLFVKDIALPSSNGHVIKAPHNWPFARRIHCWFPHKGPVMRHDITRKHESRPGW